MIKQQKKTDNFYLTWCPGMLCNVLDETYNYIEMYGAEIVSKPFNFFGFGHLRICLMLADYPGAVPIDRITEFSIQEKLF